MSSDSIHIEVDKKFIQKLFELAGSPVPKELTVNEFNNALSKINRKLPLGKDVEVTADKEERSDEKIKIMMIDNVGFIMQRIKQQLSKQDYIIETFNDVSKAVERINKEYFDFIILNILIPTEREGLMFLNEVKNILATRKVRTKLIVSGDSLRKELIVYLRDSKVNHIIERKPDWINKLLEVIEKEKDILS
ncbi:MAG: response regulator [Candidatus Gastranaerophilales bacterium]|nr:response regulator [Candidatus Gastranaerophilales bacterium]